MDHRVAGGHQGRLGAADDDAVAVGVDQPHPLAEGVEEPAEALALGDPLAEFGLEVEHAGAAGADPARAPRLQRRGGWVLLGGLDHAEVGEHAAYAAHARVDGPTVHPPRLARLVEQHLGAGLTGRGAQRPVAQPGVHHHRRAEGHGQLAGALVLEVGTDLGQVGAAVRAGVEVDADLALGDHLGHHQVRDPGRQRAAARAGEGPVEVAPVGQVAVAVHEAEDVDDRHRDQRAVQLLGIEVGQHLTHHLDADGLVAVDGGVDPDGRPVVASVHHPDRQVDVGAGDQARDRQRQRLLAPGADPDRADLEGVAGHAQRPRLRRRTATGGRGPR